MFSMLKILELEATPTFELKHEVRASSQAKTGIKGKLEFNRMKPILVIEDKFKNHCPQIFTVLEKLINFSAIDLYLFIYY